MTERSSCCASRTKALASTRLRSLLAPPLLLLHEFPIFTLVSVDARTLTLSLFLTCGCALVHAALSLVQVEQIVQFGFRGLLLVPTSHCSFLTLALRLFASAGANAANRRTMGGGFGLTSLWAGSPHLRLEREGWGREGKVEGEMEGGGGRV